MRQYLKLIFLLLVTFAILIPYGYSAGNNDVAQKSNIKHQRKWGAGINNLPWENPNASIWWWKNDSVGNMLKFGLYSAPIYSESHNYSDALLYGSITYYRFRRRASIYPTLKILHGWGIGGYLHVRHPQTNRESWYTWLSVQLPLGIEHQPFQSAPFFKYSVMIDFTGRLIYEYSEYQNNTKDVTLNFSFTTRAQFWLVWYFR
jgi:hypothetical protein